MCLRKPSPAECAARCPIVATSSGNVSSYDPVCYLTRAGNSTSSTSYFNPCIAQCYAPARRVLASYKGTCNATADAACTRGVRSGSATPVCSTSSTSPAAEYPSRCYAEQLDPAGARVPTYG